MEGYLTHVGPNLNWEIDLSLYIPAATIKSPHHYGAQPHVWRVKRQLIQCSFGHDIEGRAIVDEHFGHYEVQAFEGPMQGLDVSLSLDWYLLVSESKVIIGRDVFEYALEALQWYVLCYKGFIQILTNSGRWGLEFMM